MGTLRSESCVQPQEASFTPDNRQRVLLLIANLRAGGMERQVTLLANALSTQPDLEVTVYLLDGCAPIAYELHPDVHLRHSGAASYLGLVKSLFTLPALMREQAVTLSFLDLGNLVAQLSRRGPLVWNLATTGVPAKQTSKLIHRLARSQSGRIELAIGNDQRVIDFYQNADFRCGRFLVIPNSLDTERFRPQRERRAEVRAALGLPTDALVLGAVARAHPDKRHDLLLDLLLARPGVHLLCIGDQIAEHPTLRSQIAERGLAQRVTLLNARPDIERLLPAIDLGCCVSDREGLPNSVLELMATGIPCLGTRVGGLPELLDGVGRLVDPGDLPALIAAVDDLQDPAQRTHLGNLSRQRILERFDLEQSAQRWLEALAPYLRTSEH